MSTKIVTYYISKSKHYIIRDFNLDMSKQNIATKTLIRCVEIQYILNFKSIT